MILRPVLLAALLAPAPALAADVFSPGDLSRPHAKLGGLDNCTKCHPAGEQLSQARCLACHKELAPRVDAGRGFHGRIATKERDCWTCHHEHQGKDFALVDWGPGGVKRFDHAKTGATLGGKHGGAACEKCHAPALVADPGVRQLLTQEPQRKTWLGAPPMTACASCHFDEHRAQLGAECRRCHGEDAWKPSRGFDHARTAYPLTGKHDKVACEKCHAKEEEAAPDHGALTPPVHAGAFVRYKPVKFASCLDCHKDVHQGRFGLACARCHVTDDWKRIVQGATSERGFHDKTRYPLRGAHAAVTCVACHGPFPGQPAKFKPLPFEKCTDCHADAHVGQLAATAKAAAAPAAAGAPAGAACERCHDVNGWQPARFGLEEHQQARYPLEQAHQAVACGACHPREPRLAERFPAAVKADLERKKRPVKVAHALYAVPGELARCETCHADAHAGQFPKDRACAVCHGLASFHKVRFDHGTDSRFPLRGAHAKASCASCHPAESGPQGEVVRYRPLPLACEGCHRDPHAGQLAPAGGTPARSDCARCHGEDAWKKTPAFRHEPPFTDYRLTGKHAKVACEKCHPSVEAKPGVKVVRYRPLPRSCEGCHADFHKGAFRGFVPGGTP